MKKLILLLAIVFVMCGCNMNPHITDYGVVELIEFYENKKASTNYTTKYRVTISTDFNAIWKCKSYLYTNDLYQLGDTIQITKKNKP